MAVADEFAVTSTEKFACVAVAALHSTDSPVTAMPVFVFAVGVTCIMPLAMFAANIIPVVSKSLFVPIVPVALLPISSLPNTTFPPFARVTF